MSNRLSAIAHLANHLGSITVSMGGLFVEASTMRRNGRTTYYEDHF